MPALRKQLCKSLGITEARFEGRVARKNGHRAEDNPYHYHEDEAAHDEWFFGWQEQNRAPYPEFCDCSRADRCAEQGRCTRPTRVCND